MRWGLGADGNLGGEGEAVWGEGDEEGAAGCGKGAKRRGN